MKGIHSDKVMTVIRRSLNLIDRRLVDHGVKVMLVLRDMLEADGCRDMELKKNLSLLALLHDVGAYRTEEIDNIVQFEIGNVWEHSIYGYLFLKEFTPLGEWARVVLYHHTDYSRMEGETEQTCRYAQLLHVADRAVIWHDEVKGTEEELEKHFARGRGTVFSPEGIKLWNRCAKAGTYSRLDDPEYLDSAFCCKLLDEAETNAYLAMVIYAIDFRSRVTVTHTMGVAQIGLCLARQIGLAKEACQQVYYGALLHDLGKIGTPVSILESPGRLTPEEMEVMRRHVVLSGQIIEGCAEETVARIALRHHEKLDGSGYPLGLTGEELTQQERLLAVADIVSALCMSRSYKEAYPKEKCFAILRDMCQAGQLDGEIVSVMEDSYDEIMAQAGAVCDPLLETYERMGAEYQATREKFRPIP